LKLFLSGIYHDFFNNFGDLQSLILTAAVIKKDKAPLSAYIMKVRDPFWEKPFQDTFFSITPLWRYY